jgi:hypothetical protein
LAPLTIGGVPERWGFTDPLQQGLDRVSRCDTKNTVAPPRNRQERWLHTRISEDLEEALKREARRRRSPVSLVVRNVLEGALDLVEDIVEDSVQIAQHSRRFARNVRGAARASDSDSAGVGLEAIYGWQELILNRAATCVSCLVRVPVGAQAYRGLREHFRGESGPPLFLCTACVRKLRRPVNEKEEA